MLTRIQIGKGGGHAVHKSRRQRSSRCISVGVIERQHCDVLFLWPEEQTSHMFARHGKDTDGKQQKKDGSSRDYPSFARVFKRRPARCSSDDSAKRFSLC